MRLKLVVGSKIWHPRWHDECARGKESMLERNRALVEAKAFRELLGRQQTEGDNNLKDG